MDLIRPVVIAAIEIQVYHSSLLNEGLSVEEWLIEIQHVSIKDQLTDMFESFCFGIKFL